MLGSAPTSRSACRHGTLPSLAAAVLLQQQQKLRGLSRSRHQVVRVESLGVRKNLSTMLQQKRNNLQRAVNLWTHCRWPWMMA
ncbi:hypothetical protein HYQ46_009099 [Verticillium longisporum]|nr:hypothetical protein HYQ46_009099 [Verticillium longisporum]